MQQYPDGIEAIVISGAGEAGHKGSGQSIALIGSRHSVMMKKLLALLKGQEYGYFAGTYPQQRALLLTTLK